MSKLLVVNLHGLINTPRAARETLIQLGIGRRFAATVVEDVPTSKGLITACKDYVAWAPLDPDLLTALLKSRGRISNARLLDEEGLKGLGYKSHADLANKIIDDKTPMLSSIKGLKPFFGLSPPRGGFKRPTRRQFREGGVLGENPTLPEIVRRMI